MKKMQDVLGYKLNNPGNIRFNNSNDWLGSVIGIIDDKEFEKFSSVEYGIRAIGKILNTYHRNGIRSIEAIIEKWAPSTENDTKSYVSSVRYYLSKNDLTDPTTGLKESRESRESNIIGQRNSSRHESIVPKWTWILHLPGLVAAIIHHETGIQPFSLEFIKECLQIKE